ncbi:MAG: hypothetical protein K0U72_13360 [Gammaproteobacteria bacterium]|nr:hypothetical protein [Gammaproteobacteria bacterium]
MRPSIFTFVTLAVLTLSACGTAPVQTEAAASEEVTDHGLLWVKHAAEYQAISAQVYAQAGRDLAGLITDSTWSALPGHAGDATKPVAIILDMDETIVSNVDFQIDHLPYSSFKHYVWNRDNKAVEIRGAVSFLRAARDAGVEIFFVTNRPCETVEGIAGACPQELVAIGDVHDIGFETDADHVLLAYEQPGWGKEKLSRREHIAKTHRVIMLFGDDYGDFVFCARAKPVAPCSVAASRASRTAALDTYSDYWGRGWYILPNPMHGSWTTVR